MWKEEKRIDNFTFQQIAKQASGKVDQNESVVFKAQKKRCLKHNSTRHLALAY
ncbi:hypothetical protein WN48_04062 [Eufriesea mexicana]|uniref:Uncharacterized protein n=1 Tax=Eufriesea mexicana TaxID=516756 RepID=A0A310SES6_9HYME|nr:hypothetical protein WN48_04062 [Eufriesea mexicana]